MYSMNAKIISRPQEKPRVLPICHMPSGPRLFPRTGVHSRAAYLDRTDSESDRFFDSESDPTQYWYQDMRV